MVRECGIATDGSRMPAGEEGTSVPGVDAGLSVAVDGSRPGATPPGESTGEIDGSVDACMNGWWDGGMGGDSSMEGGREAWMV